MKITIVGGGSTYTPELINGFLARTAQLPVTELWLMDIDPQRLEIVGGFAQRMVEANIACSDAGGLDANLIGQLRSHRWDRKRTEWSQ